MPVLLGLLKTLIFLRNNPRKSQESVKSLLETYQWYGPTEGVSVFA